MDAGTGSVEVAQPDTTHEALVDQGFHRPPRLGVVAAVVAAEVSGVVYREHGAFGFVRRVGAVEARCRPLARRRRRLGPVDHEGVEVIELEVLESLVQVRPNVLLSVVRIPQLGLHEELAACHLAGREELRERRPDLGLVIIIVRRVDVSIASADRRLDRRRRDARRRLPGPESDLWHRVAARQRH